jgi:gluconate 5-dehydrogenase
MFSLKNKVAIVTGAAGYLGKTFSESLLDAGAKVDLYGRGGKILNLYESLSDKYGNENVDYHDVDLHDDHKFKQALYDTIEKNDTVDILINNAYEFSQRTGFNDPSGKFENMSKEQWITSLMSGIYWPVLATQIIAEKMKEQESGSIINISSMYGLVSPDPNLYEGLDTFNPASYGAAKSALVQITKYVAAFYGKYGVRCNAIAPGAFPNVNYDSYNAPDEQILERLSNKTCLKRYGKPEDLKGAAVFLASDASEYITGQVLSVDGGWIIT